MNMEAKINDKNWDTTNSVLTQKEYKHKRFVINITWIVCLLVCIVLILLAEIFCKIITNADTIKVFIEYAATLLSITLSIFAIAFTYTSNNSMQHQFDKIDNSSRVILESSTSLQSTERELTKSISTLDERITRIETNVNFIKGNIPNEIPKNTGMTETTTQNFVNNKVTVQQPH